LEDNKIVFDECTGASRGEIICELIHQIVVQDRSNGKLFIASSANRTTFLYNYANKDLTLNRETSVTAPDGY